MSITDSDRIKMSAELVCRQTEAVAPSHTFHACNRIRSHPDRRPDCCSFPSTTREGYQPNNRRPWQFAPVHGHTSSCTCHEAPMNTGRPCDNCNNRCHGFCTRHRDRLSDYGSARQEHIHAAFHQSNSDHTRIRGTRIALFGPHGSTGWRIRTRRCSIQP